MVALLAEGVDRNWAEPVEYTTPKVSPSSRRAWIEILLTTMNEGDLVVALLAEGVDRNGHTQAMAIPAASRPPRGGRG